jgi:hypothetical protein
VAVSEVNTPLNKRAASTLMAWKGQGDDTAIYWSSSALAPSEPNKTYSWAAQQAISGAATSTGPAITVLGSTAYLAFKGVGSDQGIYLSSLDLSPRPLIIGHGSTATWTPPYKVEGVGGTSATPALAAFGDTLWLVWLEETGGSRIFWSKSTDGKTWTPQALIPSVATSDGPAIAADHNGKLYLVWKGVGSDSSIYWSTCSDGLNWAPQQKGPTGAVAGPTLVIDGNNVLSAFWPGVTPDQSIGIAINFPVVYWGVLDNVVKNDWSLRWLPFASTDVRPAAILTPTIMVAWSEGYAGQNNGASIRNISYGSALTPPMQLAFNIPYLTVKMMRSGKLSQKTETDTVYVSLSVKVKGKPAVSETKFWGELTGGQYNLGLTTSLIEVADSDTVFITYSAINKGGDSSEVASFLQGQASKILSGLENADLAALASATKIPFTMLPAQEQGALFGAQLSLILGLSNLVIPELGSIIGGIAGWFASDIWENFFPNCDGPVAFGAYAFSGSQIRASTWSVSSKSYVAEDNNPGINSNDGCGTNSDYLVGWSITDHS